MRPIKAKTLINKTAELSGFSEEDSKKIIDLYYKVIREFLSDLREPTLQLESLGNFYIKERKMCAEERRLNNMKVSVSKNIKKTLPSSPRQILNLNILRNIETKLERINNLSKMLEETKDKRALTIKKQIEFRENNKCLEESKEDNSGILEQDDRTETNSCGTTNQDLS